MNTPVTNTSVGLIGWFTLLFVGLKLTNHIDWSWWWVLSPLWITFALVLVISIIVGILVFGYGAFFSKPERRLR